MNFKPYLKSFWQILGILKVFALQALCFGFLSFAMGLMSVALGVRGCPPRYDTMGIFYWVILIVSIILVLCALYPIIAPKVWLQEINKEFINSKIHFRYPFFSTHPHYIVLDALFFIPAIALFWNGVSDNMCEYNFFWGQGVSALVIAIAFPAIRLFFWYGLHRQIRAMDAPDIWDGIIWWCVLTLPMTFYFSYVYASKNVLFRRNVPVVDAQTFKGGLAQHPEFATDEIVRVRGMMTQGIAKCGLWGKKDHADFPDATVVVTMGDGNGEILLQAKKPSAVLDLEAEATRGGIIEAFGKLSRLPNPEKKMLCGIGKLPDNPPEGGRYLLEIETLK